MGYVCCGDGCECSVEEGMIFVIDGQWYCEDCYYNILGDTKFGRLSGEY